MESVSPSEASTAPLEFPQRLRLVLTPGIQHGQASHQPQGQACPLSLGFGNDTLAHSRSGLKLLCTLHLSSCAGRTRLCHVLYQVWQINESLILGFNISPISLNEVPASHSWSPFLNLKMNFKYFRKSYEAIRAASLMQHLCILYLYTLFQE